MKNGLIRLQDEMGRITRWPKKQAEKLAVLRYIQSKFESDKEYTEPQVNAVIEHWHTFGDYALIRREMFENYLLDRSDDCRKYWIRRQAEP